MNIWIRIFSLLTALEFFYIFYLETVAATSEKTSRVFAILMLYIIGVAVYGGVSSQPKIILMQGGLPMITFILCLAALM